MMGKRTTVVVAVSTVLVTIVSLLPGSLLWAWHGTGGPTGSGTAAMGPTAFSNPLAPLLPGRGYRTCLIGDFRAIDPLWTPPPPPVPPPPVPPPPQPNPGHAAVHHWQYISRAPGSATLVLTAQSFNTTNDPGKTVTLTANHAAGTSSLTLTYPAVAGPAGAVSGFLTVPVNAGVSYDLDVSVQQAPGDPDPVNANSLHYRLGVLGPGANTVELGYGHPTLEYQEGGLQRWAVNAAPGESVNITVSVDDTSAVPTPPGVPPQATTLTYAVFDPVAGPPPVIAPTTSAISFGSPISINFTNGSGVTKSYIVRLNSDHHYKLDRSGAPDHGFYVLNCPDAQDGIVSIDIKPGSFPNSINLGNGGTVPVAIFSRPPTGPEPGFDATTVDPTTVTLAGAPVKLKGNGTPQAEQEDVNGDGLLDLVVHVETESLQLSEGDTKAILQGQTFSGTPVMGADSVRIVK
ncbi:MAG: hypothetical protein HYX97_00875 [Chloroflexi bacterium]|nr:hypothetical protein [Chloroflexota bacterium]